MRIYWYLLVGNCSSSNHSSSPLFPWHQKFNIAIQEAMVGGASILIWGEILYCRTKMPRHISLIIVVRKTDCFLITASHKSFRYCDFWPKQEVCLYMVDFIGYIFFQNSLKGLNNPKWNPKRSWQVFLSHLCRNHSKKNGQGQLYHILIMFSYVFRSPTLVLKHYKVHVWNFGQLKS